MAENITEKVTEIIVEQLGVSADKVEPEANLIEDLGADSLDAVELVMAVEEEFGIEVPDEEAEKLRTVGDIISHVISNTGEPDAIKLLKQIEENTRGGEGPQG